MNIFPDELNLQCAKMTHRLGRRLRVMQVDDFYADFLDKFYTSRPSLINQSEKAQTHALLRSGFSAIHIVAPYLPQEWFETEFVISQASAIQLAWYHERGLGLPDIGAWPKELIKKRIEIFRPDILYFSSPSTYGGDFIASMPCRPKLILGWRAADVPHDWNAHGYDIMLSGLSKLLDFAQRQGAGKGIMFKPGMPEWLAKAVANTKKTVDVCFAGTINPIQHAKRLEMLEFVAESAARHGYTLSLYLNCDEPLLTPAIRRWLKPPVFGMDMHKALAAAKIVIDIRGDIGIIMPSGERGLDLAGDETINMRMFEATGSGSLLLSEYRPGIKRYFEPGKEIDVWENFEEMERKILYWLKHDEERIQVARAGTERCINEHGMDKAAAKFAEIIINNLPDN